MKRILLIIASFALTAGIVAAQEKVFIKDYFYQASENDSKVSSRQKALIEVKTQILEEIGTYIESYVNYTVESDTKDVSKSFFGKEIKQITAGRLEVKVLEENWNGVEYYVKAQVVVDPDEILEQLHRTIENRRASVVIDSLNLLLSSQQSQISVQNSTIENLNAQLAAKHNEMESQKKEVEKLQRELDNMNSQYKAYQKQEQEINDEISRLGAQLKQMGENVINKARIGMTIQEVRKICGQPRLTDGLESATYFMNYGNVWLIFRDRVLVKGFNSKYWEGEYSLSYYRHTPNVIKSF
ncbi:MAG: hypothetical protein IIW70_07030 [Bacteroidales bacterium]|nr:hypothetical protein [Bacteroidales bacterium]